MRITVLGCRGSVSTGAADFMAFGGDTSSYLVECCDQAFILDAGSGIVHAPCDFSNPPHILLSHLHMDHLVGLAMYPRLSVTGALTRLYLPVDSVQAGHEVLDQLFGEPFWPVRIADLPGGVEVRALPSQIVAGAVRVSHIEGNHPGGCKVFRIEGAGRSLVYATDYEADDDSFERLVRFCEGVDLVLYDGQYQPEELEAHAGFGHSTPQIGIQLMERSGAHRLVIIHHDPGADDDELAERERAIGRQDVRFAREGEVIWV